MPNQHRWPATSIRIRPSLRERSKIAVQPDSTLREHIEGFLSWLVGDTDELPPRPGRRVPDEFGHLDEKR
ncbi:hypothetical protein [Mycobacteroides abscessus]|uniref:hypothetical protein n=1 Tax=Mycobacteroides abscessus TaxID=36809 RepID=UPI0009A76A5E|nr:hypothetical protein [Mycobacteroides abscessus]SLJ77694.1 Uncharacterised protein [Mycobacteroides abscessus subsp. abscessus]